MNKKVLLSRFINFFLGLIIGFFFNYNYVRFYSSTFKFEYEETQTPLPNSSVKTKCNYSSRGPRILCAIFTHKSVHNKLHFVHNTWAKRCDKTIYMTGPKTLNDNNEEISLPLIYLNITDKYERITDKAIATMLYIYENLMDDFDWYVRANDDTFIIVENLKLFLANKCPDEKIMYGKLLKHFNNAWLYRDGDNKRGFLQGGSGVLISRESVRLFVEKYKQNPNFCIMYNGRAEDQEISNCFRKLDIYPGESRDNKGRDRFLMDQFHQLWNQPSQDTLDYSFYPYKLGMDCCSDSVIGFHNIKESEHYKMDYFLYKVHPKNLTFIRDN